MPEIFDWAITEGGNNSAPPDGAPENMNRSDVNNVQREVMAVLARYYQDPEFLDLATSKDATSAAFLTTTSVRIVKSGTDLSGDYPVGRRVRVVDGGSDLDGTVTGVTYSDPNTDVTIGFVDATDVVPAGLALGDFLAHSMKTLAAGAFGSALDFLEIGVFL